MWFLDLFQASHKELGASSIPGKVRNFQCEQNGLERPAIDSESLVRKVSETLYLQQTDVCPFRRKVLTRTLPFEELSSRPGHVKPWLNLEGPPSKAKYILRSIENKYREGKVKRTPEGE